MNSNAIVIPSHVQKLVEIILTEHNINKPEKLKVSSPLQPGDNFLGHILEIKTFNPDGKSELVTLNLIAKLAPTVQIYRDFFPIRVSFEREIYMYKQVLPEIINIQTENKIMNVFSTFPKCYQTLLDETQETILLQDMKQLSYKSINHRLPIDYQHATLVMKSLGKFHALSFALRKQKPELFKKLTNNLHEAFLSGRFEKIFIKVTQNLGNQILENFEKNSFTYKAFKNFIDDPSFVIDKVLKPELDGKYAVICHGDVQTRNVLFKYENALQPDTPTDLCFIDFQLARFGSPCLDISFFMWICTDKNLRDRHYEELLEIYYSSFASFLRELGGCPETSYPIDVFKEHLQKKSVFGLFSSLWIGLGSMNPPNDIPDASTGDNFNSIIEDHSRVFSSDFFIRMKDAVEDFIKYKYEL